MTMKFGQSQGMLPPGAGQTGVGKSVERVEDARLLTGGGRYTDDLQLPGMAYGVTLRSPYGHAAIARIDASAARAMPGVLAVYLAGDLGAYGEVPCAVPLSGPIKTPRPLLAKDRVRFVGDGIAFIVAETREQARAAADAIEIDFDELPAVVTIEAATAPGAPAIWPDAPDNIVFNWEVGDGPAADAAIASAAHVTRLAIVQNRVAPTSMEVRAAVGTWDGPAAPGIAGHAEGFYTLHTGSQGVAGMRQLLAGMILKCPPEQLRIVTGDVGGGFGMKSFLYAEYALVLHAARMLGRPVKWTGERSDAFQTDTHGRAMESIARLAFDPAGRITALKVETWSDLGAYQSQFGPAIQTLAGGRIMGGVYRIPAIHNAVHGVMTNTAPVDAYRGAGRPESAYVMERLLEAAARELGLGVDEIRRRNLLTPDQLPHDNGLGLQFDIGNFPAVLDKALANADWAGFPARKTAAQARGKRYGRGLCYYVEIAGGGSRDEFADVRVLSGGLVEVAVGTQSNGQGHETVYAQVTAERLGIPMEQVRIVQGDTDRLEQGSGTGGSRSMAWGGAACLQVADDVIARGLQLARESLGDEVDYADGLFRARGSNATLSLEELADRNPGKLDGRARFAPAEPRPTFPNGCHVAEVEIDPETGRVEVTRYSLVDDFGTIVNPMLLLGQIHGGVAQGLGQVLTENIVYDENAQLLTGSFMDYGIPRADDMPAEIGFDTLPTISPTNPLGAKGCGEAGTIGAMPSVMNAIIDALDGTQLEMPASPEKIWRICRELSPAMAAE
jgi:aerobic carbon-monoxide dehydrogenase large subunit